jgi:hypothetical protein
VWKQKNMMRNYWLICDDTLKNRVWIEKCVVDEVSIEFELILKSNWIQSKETNAE